METFILILAAGFPQTENMDYAQAPFEFQSLQECMSYAYALYEASPMASDVYVDEFTTVVLYPDGSVMNADCIYKEIADDVKDMGIYL